MAKLLTKSYQKISTIKLTYGEIRTYAKLVDQDIEENLSNYKLKMTYYLSQWIETSSATGTLDGKSKSYGYTRFNAGETTILEVSRKIEHNEDGSSPTKNVSSKWKANFGGSGSTDEDIIMPKIDRLATITDSPSSLTDENTSITFSYSNPAGFKIKPSIMITQDSSIGYTYDEYITDNPFTWNWLVTEQDRTRLYGTVLNSTKATLSLRLHTYDNNDTLLGTTSVDIPFELVNCNPLVELETEEQNTKVKTVVGNNKIVLNYASQLKATATFSGAKGATLKKININGAEGSTSPFEIVVNVEKEDGSNAFVVTATTVDSRGLSDIADNIYQLIDYRPVTINSYKFKRESPVSSNIYLTADITYWGINLNGTSNVPTLLYSTDGTNFITIPSSAYLIDASNHKITINNYNVPTKLQYNKQGTYYLKVNDLFTEDNENEIVTKGIPIFEKGEHDVQVNGTLYVADENRQNRKAIKPAVDTLDGNETDQSPSVNAVNEAIANIIESGSNVNGSYIKYSDGTMVVSQIVEGSIDISKAWGSLYVSEDIKLPNFPVSFIKNPTTVVSPQTQSGTQFMLVGSGGSGNGDKTFGGHYALVRPNSKKGVAYVLEVIAIGKWK